MFVAAETLRKPTEHREARRLRREEGMPIKQIAARLRVSPSTVNRWTRDIELTPEQWARNTGRPGQPGWVLTDGKIRKAREVRIEYQEEGRRHARGRWYFRAPVSASIRSTSNQRKRGRIPYGVCTVRVCSTRLVQHIYGAIQEYAGFEEPRWLDGPPIKPRRRKPRTPAPISVEQ